MDLGQPDPPYASPDAVPGVHWSARARQLAGDVAALTGEWLRDPLQWCLHDFDRALQERMATATRQIEQQRFQSTRQRLTHERQRFGERFIANLEQGLEHLGEPVRSSGGRAPSRMTLSLLDPGEHDLSAALDQLVARSEARTGPQLVELGYRMAVLVGLPPLEGEALPLGPHAMMRAFRAASAALDLAPDLHLLLLRSMEGRLVDGLAPLYEKVNAYLAAQGILPCLRPFPLPRSGPRTPRAGGVGGRSASTKHPAAGGPTAGDSLRGLLPGHGGLLTEAEVATNPAVQAALKSLHARWMRDGDPQRVLEQPARLHDALVEELNRERLPGTARMLLSPAQAEVVELVARLFRTLRAMLDARTSAGLLDQAQLPVTRAALADPGFLDHAAQPVRRWLDRLLLAADWLEGNDSETDRVLRTALEEQLVQFDQDVGVADSTTRLIGELEQRLAQLQRRAQLVERRQIEAAQGRERLEQARERAAELMAERLAGTDLPAPLRATLCRPWADVLALTLLREGEQSETFARQLVVTDQLLGHLPAGNPATLLAAVEAGLQQIGMHGAEATQRARELIGGATRPAASTAGGPAALASRLRASPRPATATAVAEAPGPAPEAGRLHRELVRPDGERWYEFTDPAAGRARRKLAWHSPQSGRSLFVTRQGQRVAELTLAQLAQGLADGCIRPLAAESASPLARAWRQLADELRTATTPEPWR